MKKAIVTAADTSHGLSVARLVNLCKEQMSSFDMYVFDLGLTDEDIAGIDDKAHIIKYDYANMPDWHNVKVNAGGYGWKPVCVHAIAPKADLLFWIDAGCFIKNGLSNEVLFAKENGIFASTTKGTLEEYTDPRTIEAITAGKHKDFRMRASSLVGFNLTNQKVKALIKDWYLMAQLKDVFIPEGSSKHPIVKGDTNPQFNHRQDQSVFNALLAMYGFNKFGQRWNFVIQKDIDHRPRNITTN